LCAEQPPLPRSAFPHWLKVVIAMTLIATGLRFFALESSPPGFYRDEAAYAAQVICIRQSGHDLEQRNLPLMSTALPGGYVTPAYLYTGAAWTAVFGDSIASFRSLSAAYGALTVAGVYFLALTLWRKRESAWLAALCAAFSPWGFIFSRIAWDPPLAPCFLVWSLYFLLRGGRTPVWNAALAGVLAALACYSYPPMRAQALMVFPAVALYLWFVRSDIRYTLATFVLVAALALIPLVRLTLSGEIQGRFNMLNIFNEHYLAQFGGSSFLDVAKIFFQNLGSHLSATYLFLHGDRNLRHSTRAVGEWSWLEIFALAAAAFYALRAFVSIPPQKWRDLEWREPALLVWCYFAALVPAALTWEGNPHALRSIGAYPFVALLSGRALDGVCRIRPWAPWMVIVIGVAFASWYGSDFFLRYPQRSYVWFDTHVVKKALSLNSNQDSARLPEELGSVSKGYPDLAIAYFQLRSGIIRCARETRE